MILKDGTNYAVPRDIDLALTEISVEMKERFPLVSLYELPFCQKCKRGTYMYQVYEAATGFPKMEFAVYVLSYGDGTSPFLSGGVLGTGTTAVKDHGNGCFGASIQPKFKDFDAGALRKQVFEVAEEISQKLAAQVAA